MISIQGDDFLDPRNWGPDDREYRLYVDDKGEEYVFVSAEMYPLLVRYKWSIHSRKKWDRGFRYVRRGLSEFWGPEGEMYESPISGKLVRNRRRTQRTRLLHVEILELAGKERPSPEHNEGDHIDRDTQNYRTENLRWATREMQVNNSNKEGARKGREAQARRRAERQQCLMG